MANFLTILDNNEAPLGYLTKAKNVEIRERLNGESLLSFELAYDTDEASHVNLENYIKDDRGQLFVIKEIEQSDNGKRSLIVRAVHVKIELIDDFIDRTLEFYHTTAEIALTEALKGTDFVVGTATPTEYYDIDLTEMSVMKAVQEIRKKWNCDLWFDNRTVYLGEKKTDNGKEIRYSKNLKSLTRPSSTANVITRLFPYGKDGLTIEGVNNGVKYIDSVNIGNYRKPKAAAMHWREINDPQELKDRATIYLADHDDVEISYQADFVELSKLGYKESDIEIGEIVTITHLPFNFTTSGTRVVEYVRYPFEPKIGHVILSSFIERPLDNYVNLKRDQQDFQRYSDKISKTPATVIVADGSTSKNTKRADFVVPRGAKNAQETINTAIRSIKPLGGKVLLLEGTYLIDGSIELQMDITLEGFGHATVIKVNDNVTHQITAVSATSDSKVSNVLIDGNKGVNGQVVDCVDSYQDSDVVVSNCILKNARYGVYISDTDKVSINQNIISNCDIGVYVTIGKEGSVVSNITNSCVKGIELYRYDDCSVSSNSCSGVSEIGIRLYESKHNSITNNTCNNNGTHGITLYYSHENTVSNNTCSKNGGYGILVFVSTDNNVNGNTCVANSQSSDSTYSNIGIGRDGNYNNLQNNICRVGSLTNKPNHGINVFNTSATGNLITNNDLYNSGTSGSYSDSGTGNVTTSGNRL